MKLSHITLFASVLFLGHSAFATCSNATDHALVCTTVVSQTKLITLKMSAMDADCKRQAHLVATDSGVNKPLDTQLHQVQPADGGGDLLVDDQGFVFRQITQTGPQLFGVLSLSNPFALVSYPIVCQ